MALSCLLALALPIGVAMAQTAPASTVIDLKPLLDQVIWPFAVMLVGVLATWLAGKVAKLLGLKSDAEVRAYLEPALQNALAYAQARTGQLPLTIDAKNQIVATAANFAIAHVADGLKILKIDKEGVERMLRARLEANVSAQIPDVTATAAAPMATTSAKPADPVPTLGA